MGVSFVVFIYDVEGMYFYRFKSNDQLIMQFTTEDKIVRSRKIIKILESRELEKDSIAKLYFKTDSLEIKKRLFSLASYLSLSDFKTIIHQEQWLDYKLSQTKLIWSASSYNDVLIKTEKRIGIKLSTYAIFQSFMGDEVLSCFYIDDNK